MGAAPSMNCRRQAGQHGPKRCCTISAEPMEHSLTRTWFLEATEPFMGPPKPAGAPTMEAPSSSWHPQRHPVALGPKRRSTASTGSGTPRTRRMAAWQSVLAVPFTAQHSLTGVGTAGQRGSLRLRNGIYASPPASAGGSWQQYTLHSFWPYTQALGMDPFTGLLLSGGSLYGTTYEYGFSVGCGAVYALSPPATGSAWTATAIHSFGGGDGCSPAAPLTRGPAGVLYGTTLSGGTLGGCNLAGAGGCGVV